MIIRYGSMLQFQNLRWLESAYLITERGSGSTSIKKSAEFSGLGLAKIYEYGHILLQIYCPAFDVYCRIHAVDSSTVKPSNS